MVLGPPLGPEATSPPNPPTHQETRTFQKGLRMAELIESCTRSNSPLFLPLNKEVGRPLPQFCSVHILGIVTPNLSSFRGLSQGTQVSLRSA